MKCQREKFLLQRKYAYLNCAYMSPMMKKVENAGIKGMVKKRKPYKIGRDDFFKDAETVRSLFGKLIHSEDPSRSVILPSVSYGIATVVKNLPKKKGKIIIVEGQFPSNVYPWMRLEDQGYTIETVKPKKGMRKGEDWNAKILEAIDAKTIALAIGHVHWADGTLFQLKEIRKRLDEVNGLLIVDGTQSVGALPFDVAEIRPDALICAAYKWLMGPYSIGLGYFGKRFDEGVPIEENWINRLDSDNFSGLLNYQDQYRDGATRYSVGEHSNFILLPMLKAALKQIITWSPEAIQQYCGELMLEAIVEAGELGFESESANSRSAHLFGLQLPDGITGEAAMKKFKEKKVSVSLRGDIIRVSPHVYNDAVDVRKFVGALKALRD